MDVWQESEHPRDNIGRFTYKNGGESSEKERKSSSLNENLNDEIRKRMYDSQKNNEISRERNSVE